MQNNVALKLDRAGKGHLVLMAYRKSAEGSDGTITHIRNEIAYSDSVADRVRIIVGQETSDVQPRKITHFDSSFRDMVAELSKIRSSVAGSSNAAGFAFNDADAFLEM
jgi:hypothetical protein